MPWGRFKADTGLDVFIIYDKRAFSQKLTNCYSSFLCVCVHAKQYEHFWRKPTLFLSTLPYQWARFLFKGGSSLMVGFKFLDTAPTQWRGSLLMMDFSLVHTADNNRHCENRPLAPGNCTYPISWLDGSTFEMSWTRSPGKSNPKQEQEILQPRLGR